MMQEDIIIGTADAKTGDTSFSAFTKVQHNFDVLFDDNLSSTITANQANIATTLGGIIDSTKVYVLDGIIDFTGTGLNITIPAGGISILGTTFDISKIICSDTNYTLFDSPGGGSGNILGMDYAVEVTGLGSQVYDLTDATGFNAFEFSRVNYNDCSSLGTISDYRQGLESGTGRFGGKPELTLAGTWLGGYFIDTSIVRNLVDGAYSLFKAGAGFSMASRFRSNQNMDLNSTISFLDFTPSNFTNSLTLQLDGCLISRNGVFDPSDSTITPNVSETDVISKWQGNVGIENTFEGGALEVTASAATTISATNTFVDVAGTFTATSLDHFDSPSNGKLRYLANIPKQFQIVGTVTGESAANDVIGLRIAIFRDSSSTFEFSQALFRQVNSLVGGRDVATFTQIGFLSLNENDIVNLQVSNETSTTNVTMEDFSFIRIEER